MALLVAPVQAAPIPDDYYAQDETSQRREEPTLATQILNSPAAIPGAIKTSIKKALNWIERYYVVDKVTYICDKIHDMGLYPLLTHMGEERGYPDGVAFHNSLFMLRGAWGDDQMQPIAVQYFKEDLVKNTFLAKQIGPSVWGRWSFEGYQDYGARLKFTDVVGTKNSLELGFRFQSAPKEDFFGLGPHSHRSTSYTFDLQETALNVIIERELLKHLKGEAGFGYSHVEISNSRDKSKAPIFTLTGLPGVADENDLIYGGLGLDWDTRDEIDNPHRGGFVNFSWGTYGGSSDTSDMAYMKYRVDVARYLDLKCRRVLAGRFFFEYNDRLSNHGIPFFDEAQLGGPRTVRGYQFNRFFDRGAMAFNLEYRFTIWKFRQVEWDVYPFWDVGWVFPTLGRMEFDAWKPGYGAGTKFRWLKHGSISFEVAHGNEGTDFYVKYTPTF